MSRKRTVTVSVLGAIKLARDALEHAYPEHVIHDEQHQRTCPRCAALRALSQHFPEAFPGGGTMSLRSWWKRVWCPHRHSRRERVQNPNLCIDIDCERRRSLGLASIDMRVCVSCGKTWREWRGR